MAENNHPVSGKLCVFVDDAGVGLAGGQIDIAHEQADLVLGIQIVPDVVGQFVDAVGDEDLLRLTFEGGQRIAVLLVGVDEVADACNGLLKLEEVPRYL